MCESKKGIDVASIWQEKRQKSQNNFAQNDWEEKAQFEMEEFRAIENPRRPPVRHLGINDDDDDAGR